MRLACLLPLLMLGCFAPARQIAPPLPQPAGAKRLWPMATAFVRPVGYGQLPLPAAEARYSLCLDGANDARLAVRDPQSGAAIHDAVAEALRGWHWKLLSNAKQFHGQICWVERIAPATDAAGQPVPSMQLEASPRFFGLAEDGNSNLYLLPAPREDGDTIEAIEIREQDGVRLMVLRPRLSSDDPTRQPKGTLLQPVAQPHLPDIVKIERRGSLVVGSYRVCFDTRGQGSATPEIPVLGANHGIVTTLGSWRIAPPAEPGCSIATFVFTIG